MNVPYVCCFLAWCFPCMVDVCIKMHQPFDSLLRVLQVLLATGGKHLVYLEIGDGVLIEKKYVQLDFEISCLDINPIGENPNYSQLAAVGMWTDISVQIYSLPDLNRITKEHLGGEIIPRSVLLCTFEGVCLLEFSSVNLPVILILFTRCTRCFCS